VVAANLVGTKERMWQRIWSGRVLILSSVGINRDISRSNATAKAKKRDSKIFVFAIWWNESCHWRYYIISFCAYSL
jgi:hypothetical protein